MGFRYPELTPAKVRKLLRKAGFKKARQEGSHEQWEGHTKGQRRIVTVDSLGSKKETYGARLIQSMVNQSGLSKKEFYKKLN
ncbi:MAG: type II toxin-antitoxin system HicA family toxin [Deltaproteobacteria bacterium]|nr:type II toxin-antitoxin system HicA family toxin [Candidatus Tharpella aukensis]